MFKKAAFVTTLAVVMTSAIFGASVALADGGDSLIPVYTEGNGWADCFADGRLNNCDLLAPLGIYVTRETTLDVDANGVPAWNDDGTPAYKDAVTGIELWGAASGYANETKILSMSVEEIQAAVAAGNDADVVLAKNDGYTFGYSATGYFWVTAPDGYSFVWEGADLLG
jgi:hypothetical protein